MSRGVEIHLDHTALKHNLSQVSQYASHSKIMAMVKANAYGHGLESVLPALESADAFGVACLEEAKIVRELGFHHRIILMAGFFSIDELALIEALNVEIVVHHHWQIDVLEKTKLKNPLIVWLKINTGMNRLGFFPEEAERVYHKLSSLPTVEKINLMTHFACADDSSSSMTAQQIESFNHAIGNLSGEKSLANSAAVIAYPESHADWVRPGLMLYGVSPIMRHEASAYKLKPVMQLSAQIIATRHQKKDDPIGYGSTFVCPENMPIGIVAMGYGDGYSWFGSNCAPVIVNGQRTTILGRVAMDLVAVDLRLAPETKVGDRIIFWGPELPIEQVADAIGTIPYTLLTSVRLRCAKLGGDHV